MLLTHEEEAELRGELKRSMEIAQTLMKKGWSKEKIAETVKLDIPTVESLSKGQTQGTIQL